MKVNYNIANDINSQVNNSVTYKTDLAQYNSSEFWIEAGQYGDCEDYALLKRALLLEQGTHHDDIYLALCWCETGEYHCVLVVETEKGAYVLDNRYPFLTEPKMLNYKWDKALRGNKWFELSF